MTRWWLPLMALPALCVSAWGDVIDVSGVMNIAFGTATFNGSQTTAVTAETSITPGVVPASVLGSVLLDLGPGIVNQFLADPLVLTATPSFPSFVLSALPGLESAKGLGVSGQGIALALSALLSDLEPPATPFAVASDTGTQYFPDPSYDMLVNVNFHQDSLQLVATPEPPPLVLLASIQTGAFASRRRSREECE
jgi:hypothetical protein